MNASQPARKVVAGAAVPTHQYPVAEPYPPPLLGAPVHVLKCESRHYSNLQLDLKRFELRQNDRNFQVGDYLLLCETVTNNVGVGFTGKWILRRVTQMVSAANYPAALRRGFVVMSVSRGSEMRWAVDVLSTSLDPRLVIDDYAGQQRVMAARADLLSAMHRMFAPPERVRPAEPSV